MKVHNLIIHAMLVLLAIGGMSSCEAQDRPAKKSTQKKRAYEPPQEFREYWFAGEAELNRYELVQNRYGEPRRGEAVMVFVTEDFLPYKQVKKEFGDKKSLPVLKLNYLKKFVTGIYDYSLMTSVFTPIDRFTHPATLKVAFSSQDWCGQTFTQLNTRGRNLEYSLYSYFQSEGDKKYEIPATYLEDDLWNRLRLDPQALPLGQIKMIPSLEFLRLHHRPMKHYDARASLFLQVTDKESGKEEFYTYKLNYPELHRTLTIRCESSFPYRILGFEEKARGLGADSTTTHTTSATLKETLKGAYWEQNETRHEYLRDSLGLTFGAVVPPDTITRP